MSKVRYQKEAFRSKDGSRLGVSLLSLFPHMAFGKTTARQNKDVFRFPTLSVSDSLIPPLVGFSTRLMTTDINRQIQ